MEKHQKRQICIINRHYHRRQHASTDNQHLAARQALLVRALIGTAQCDTILRLVIKTLQRKHRIKMNQTSHDSWYLTSVQLLYLSVSTSAYPSDASPMVVKKRKIIKPHHVSNAPKKSASKLSIYKHLFQCIQSILHSRWNHPTFVLQAISIRNTKTPSPQKKQRPPPTEDRDLKIDALIFWDVKNSVPINHGSHWFLNSMTLIESKGGNGSFFCNFFGCKQLSIDLGTLKTGCCLV